MKSTIKLLALTIVSLSFYAFKPQTYTLTVKVSDIRNPEGVIQFALYNKEGAIPDKEFKKYFKLSKGKIIKGGEGP